jgi:histidyl-tRNA synthetase
MQDLLEDFGLLPDSDDRRLEAFVIDADPQQFETVVSVVGVLRSKGVRADFSYRRRALGKQLKDAASLGCAVAVILGRETGERNSVALKDLATGRQREVPLDELLADPGAVLRSGETS